MKFSVLALSALAASTSAYVVPQDSKNAVAARMVVSHSYSTVCKLLLTNTREAAQSVLQTLLLLSPYVTLRHVSLITRARARRTSALLRSKPATTKARARRTMLAKSILKPRKTTMLTGPTFTLVTPNPTTRARARRTTLAKSTRRRTTMLIGLISTLVTPNPITRVRVRRTTLVKPSLNPTTRVRVRRTSATLRTMMRRMST
jgi:hypothetical protein